MKLEFESNPVSLPLVDQDDVNQMISDGNSPEVTQMLRDGIKAAQDGKRADARTLLLRVTEADVSNENAWLWLASISEYPEELLVFLKNVLGINPNNERAVKWAKATEALMAKTFVQRGIDASKNEMKDMAKQCFLQAIVHDHKSELAWLWLASVTDSTEEKVSHLQKVLNINPENENALSSLKNAKTQMAKALMPKANSAAIAGERTEAIKLLDEILNDAPDFEDAWMLKAHLAESFEEKIAYFEQVLEVNPENQVARTNWDSLQMIVSKSMAEASAESVLEVKEEEEVSAQESTEDIQQESDSQDEPQELELEELELEEESVNDLELSEVEDEPILEVDGQEIEQEYVEEVSDKFDEEEAEVADLTDDAEEQNLEASVEELEEVSLENEVVENEPVANFDEVESSDVYFEDVEHHQDIHEEYIEDIDYYDDSEEFQMADEPVHQEVSDEVESETEVKDELEVKEEEETEEVQAIEESQNESLVDEVESNDDAEANFVAEMPQAVEAQEQVELDSEPSTSEFDEMAVAEKEEVQALEEEEEEEVSMAEESAVEKQVETSVCPFCSEENDHQTFACGSCKAILSLSDLEMLLSHEKANQKVIKDAIDRMEVDKSVRGVEVEELKYMGLGYINLKEYRKGFEYLQEASQKDSQDIMLSSQIDALAARISEIEEQEKDFDAQPKAKTILVVDDSPTVRKLITGKLEKSGHKAISAVDGMDALAKINEIVPDLILLDITMPRMDGYQVCKLIRGNEATKDVPVVMISGKDGFFDKVRGKMAGTNSYITKPFGPETLMKMVNEFIS